MIMGVGVDIIEVSRMARALARREAAFFRRVFTEGEQRDCRSRRAGAACFASRFAAKEAVMKALGCGWGPVGWTDVEIRRTPSGRPAVALHGSRGPVGCGTRHRGGPRQPFPRARVRGRLRGGRRPGVRPRDRACRDAGR